VLPVIVNRKTVDPNDPSSTRVIQLESAMGVAIGSTPGARPVLVPRTRCAPVKTTNDRWHRKHTTTRATRWRTQGHWRPERQPGSELRRRPLRRSGTARRPGPLPRRGQPRQPPAHHRTTASARRLTGTDHVHSRTDQPALPEFTPRVDRRSEPLNAVHRSWEQAPAPNLLPHRTPNNGMDVPRCSPVEHVLLLPVRSVGEE
jgi:hypothetical protein